MLGGICGIIDFNKASISPNRIHKMMILLGNEKVIRQSCQINNWFYGAQIGLQPLERIRFYEDLQFFVIADALIVNRQALCTQLMVGNATSDNELILHSYKKWGKNCVDYLEGLFAFTIWDKKKEVLFCARDPMGKRPFCYSFEDGIFRFASEPKTIIEDIQYPLHYNRRYFINYLEKTPNETHTFIKSIKKLPPASTLIVHKNNIEINKYWLPQPQQQIYYKTTDDYLSLIEETTTKILREHWEHTDKVSFWIDGNPKSAALVAMYAKAFPDKELIGINYKASGKYASQLKNDDVLARLKKQFNFQLIQVTEENFGIPTLEQTYQKFWENDGPYANPTGSDHNVLYPATTQAGQYYVSGDKFFNPFIWGGNEYYRNLALSLRWQTLFDEFKYVTNKKRRFKELCLDLAPKAIVKRLSIYKNNFSKRSLDPSIIKPSLLNRQDRWERQRIEGAYPFLFRQNDLLSYFKKQCLGSPKSLTIIERRHNVSPFTPFKDRRLIDLALKIPIKQFAGTQNRTPLFERLLIHNSVPSDIIHAKKKFSWPIDLPVRKRLSLPFLISDFKKQAKHPIFLDLVNEERVGQILEQAKTTKIRGTQYQTIVNLFLLNHFFNWSSANYNIFK